ncbi:hypothetical protein CAEBREN_22904 [Caenorhabditis brenneri]|uniref:Uncharacterized protein n=1 Tax=Caenorhabditis brenneri TaxID=135651 RepID=G0NKC1_CAEBE|nr:hypothetical protein CAEBREN_22904 [Caenorhabditis brenneri]
MKLLMENTKQENRHEEERGQSTEGRISEILPENTTRFLFLPGLSFITLYFSLTF